MSLQPLNGTRILLDGAPAGQRNGHALIRQCRGAAIIAPAPFLSQELVPLDLTVDSDDARTLFGDIDREVVQYESVFREPGFGYLIAPSIGPDHGHGRREIPQDPRLRLEDPAPGARSLHSATGNLVQPTPDNMRCGGRCFPDP